MHRNEKGGTVFFSGNNCAICKTDIVRNIAHVNQYIIHHPRNSVPKNSWYWCVSGSMRANLISLLGSMILLSLHCFSSTRCQHNLCSNTIALPSDYFDHHTLSCILTQLPTYNLCTYCCMWNVLNTLISPRLESKSFATVCDIKSFQNYRWRPNYSHYPHSCWCNKKSETTAPTAGK